jgi:homoserine O-acetyltransferase
MMTFRKLAVAFAMMTAATMHAGAAPGASEGGKSGAGWAAPDEATATFTDYHFASGETLQQLRLHYATLGRPHRNADGAVDNAVLFLHWTGASGQALLTQEYRAALFGLGAPFDAERYFIILPDAIGHGQSSKPSDGPRGAFPHYGYGDMVELQHKLVSETLGIAHLRAIVGMSMGCMNAWQWAEAYPDAADGIMPVACFPSPISGRDLLWRRMVVDGIRSDPAWAGGNYTLQPPSVSYGLGVLRLMTDGVPRLQEAVSTRESVEAFIGSVKARASGFDANDLIYSLESSADFDAVPGFSGVRARIFAVNFADDEFYRASLQTLERDIRAVPGARFVVRPVSKGSVGHMSMAHPALWADRARDFVGRLGAH